MPRSRIEVIRETLRNLTPEAAQVGELFHRRLFEIAPELEPLFENFFASGGNKFRVVSEVVNLHLRSLVALPVTADGEKPPVPPAVRKLGERHVKFNLTEVHFAKMKEALLWTLERSRGAEFSKEEGEAWAAAFDSLAEMMMRSMKKADAGDAKPAGIAGFLRAREPAAAAAAPLARFFKHGV